MSDITLALDGSTTAGSVALLAGTRIIAEARLAAEPGGRSGERLLPLIAQCMREVSVASHAIARVICGAGPGSFTSLRVAASIAKGIATGTGRPLYAVSSLLLIPAGVIPALPRGDYLAVLDAMRGEHFVARVRVDGHAHVSLHSTHGLVSSDDLPHQARQLNARVIGPGREFDASPHARGSAVVLDQILNSEPCNLDTWEPDYGRLAEAQIRWERAHGRALSAPAP